MTGWYDEDKERNFMFHTMRGTSWVAKNLITTQGLLGISICKVEATFANYMQKGD